MHTAFKNILPVVLLAGLTLNLRAQGTAFTYQGRLAVGTASANGTYDLTFALYDSPDSQGNLLAGPVTNTAVAVSNGLFTTLVDFGNVFTNGDDWLQIAVSTNGANAFVGLNPRQQLTPVPYAISAIGISGTVALSQLPAGVVTNNATGLSLGGTFSGNLSGGSNYSAASLVGTFTGNGAGLTNLSAGSISSGSLSLAQLPPQAATNINSLYGSQDSGFDFYEDFRLQPNQAPWNPANLNIANAHWENNTAGNVCISNGSAFVQWPASVTNYGVALYYQYTSSVPVTLAECTWLVTTNNAPGNNFYFCPNTTFILSVGPLIQSYSNLACCSSWTMHMIYQPFGATSLQLFTNGILAGFYTGEVAQGRSGYFLHNPDRTTAASYVDLFTGTPSKPMRLGYRRVNYNTLEVFQGDWSCRWSLDAFTNFWGMNLPNNGNNPLTNYIVIESYNYPGNPPPGALVKWLGFGYGSMREDNNSGVYQIPEPVNAEFSYPQNVFGSNIYTLPGGQFSGNAGGLTNVNEMYVSQSTNYTPATWTPVPGQVIFRASNNWMYAITVAWTNAIFQINP